MPNSKSRMPIASCKRCRGTRSRSGPSATTMRISNARPANAPSPAGRQPRTVATASTIVSASPASTSEARNAPVTAAPIWAQLAVTGCLRELRLFAGRCVGPYGPPLKLAVDHEYLVPELNEGVNALPCQRRAEHRREHDHCGQRPAEEGVGESPTGSALRSSDAHRCASPEAPQRPERVYSNFLA